MKIEVSSFDAATIWEALCKADSTASSDDICRETGLPVVRVVTMLGRMQLAGLLDVFQPTSEEVALALEQSQEIARQARDRAAAQVVKRVRQAPPIVKAQIHYQVKKSLGAMEYATAVEIGVPLDMLEKTVSLSKDVRRKAYKLANSGEVDAAVKAKVETRLRRSKDELRGRAASRAAATDLAKLVLDVSRVLPVSVPMDTALQALLPVVSVDKRISKSSIETPALSQVRAEVARQASQALEALVLALEQRPR